MSSGVGQNIFLFIIYIVEKENFFSGFTGFIFALGIFAVGEKGQDGCRQWSIWRFHKEQGEMAGCVVMLLLHFKFILFCGVMSDVLVHILEQSWLQAFLLFILLALTVSHKVKCNVL